MHIRNLVIVKIDHIIFDIVFKLDKKIVINVYVILYKRFTS